MNTRFYFNDLYHIRVNLQVRLRFTQRSLFIYSVGCGDYINHFLLPYLLNSINYLSVSAPEKALTIGFAKYSITLRVPVFMSTETVIPGIKTC